MVSLIRIPEQSKVMEWSCCIFLSIVEGSLIILHLQNKRNINKILQIEASHATETEFSVNKNPALFIPKPRKGKMHELLWGNYFLSFFELVATLSEWKYK